MRTYLRTVLWILALMVALPLSAPAGTRKLT